MPVKEAPFLRFMSGYSVDHETGCWNWTGARMTSGYGEIKQFGRFIGAHRLAYELYNGTVPNGMEVLHSCDNKLCVNPAHLSVGTHQRNMQEAKERGLYATGVNHPYFGKPSHLRGARIKTARHAVVLGKVFGSLKAAEREFGLGSGTVAYWIRTKNPKARELSKDEYFRLSGAPKTVQAPKIAQSKNPGK